MHRTLGPGLLESAYRVCLAHELRKRKFDVVEEKMIPVEYDGLKLECGFRADLIVNGLVVVELKAKSNLIPIDHAQLLSHLRLLNLSIGLLLNFHEVKLIDGLHRIVNRFIEVNEGIVDQSVGDPISDTDIRPAHLKSSKRNC